MWIRVYKINNSNTESANITVEYFQSISRTKNFSLIKKFLKKSDKDGN